MGLDFPDFFPTSRDFCILDDSDMPRECAAMRDPLNLPDSVVALMAYVDNADRTEQVELVVHIMMASTHPDVESSIATAAFLPRSVRLRVADFLREILVGDLGDQQRHAIFAWTQSWALASLDQ